MSSSTLPTETVRFHYVFLIRHGETVDNVAQLYAGVRDSALTNHGVQQASRLAEYFAKSNITFTHVFSSDLDRAFRTAEAIRKTQPLQNSLESFPTLETVKLPLLREQDFGYFEGKPFTTRTPGNRNSGKETFSREHLEKHDFKDMESNESMANRADTFLDSHLLPILTSDLSRSGATVAVVSHGMLLSTLWRQLLKRLPSASITLDPELLAKQVPISLERLGGWSNTGYLELEMHLPATTVRPQETCTRNEVAISAEEHSSAENVLTDQGPRLTQRSWSHTSAVLTAEDSEESWSTAIQPVFLNGWRTLIKAINSKEHLKGLKRTGGGVGSAKHDENQVSIDTFFKKQRTA